MKSLLIILCSYALLTACNHNPAAILAASKNINSQGYQWYCQANDHGQWHCSNVADIETRVITKQAAITTSKIIKPPITALPIVKEQHITTETSDHNNLFDYPNHYVAVQLLAAKQQQTINDFQQQYSNLSAKQLTITSDDANIHILLLGIYASYSEAKTAISAIDPPLQFMPWIRPLAPIKSNIASH